MDAKIVGPLRATVASIVGRVQDAAVLDSILFTLSCQYRRAQGGFHLVGRGRSDAAIKCGARILREGTFLATRTLEGQLIPTGIVIVDRFRVEELIKRHEDRWIALWSNGPTLDNPSAFAETALLADGRTSVLAVDTAGRVRGIIGVSRRSTAEDLARRMLGYAITTTRHRETSLWFSGGRIALHNGFEWTSGYQNDGTIESIWLWADRERHKPILDKIARRKFPVAWPINRRDFHRWSMFGKLIEALSDRRLSSIVAVCRPEPQLDATLKGILAPLRSDFGSIRWRLLDRNLEAWLNVLRLDGVHVVSTDLRMLKVCQRVHVPSQAEGSEGTGRSAAQFLSKHLGEMGLVVKVSADGPVRVFYKGASVEQTELY